MCGFYLIELLVVIAIIAILAAILLPRIINCTSNARQSLVAISSYGNDYCEYPVDIHPDKWDTLVWASGSGAAVRSLPYHSVASEKQTRSN